MKTLTSVQEWMETNPSNEEVQKVLNLVNKRVVTKTRREIYEYEKEYRKLIGIEKRLKEIQLLIPKEISLKMKDLNSKILDLKKGLPETRKKAKNEVKK